MSRKLFIDLLKIVVPFALIWGIFTYYPFLRDGLGITIPVEQEEKLGDAIVDQLEGKDGFREVQDSLVKEAVLRIEGRLVKEVGLTEFEYDIRVIESEKVNAFTLPGGHIFVFSGLIEISRNPEEVAAVVAHEIGHVEKRHVMERFKREFGKSVLLSILGGSQGGTLIRSIGSNTISATFNRDQEREADRFALRLMEQSGIDPEHLGKIFQRMKEKKYSGEGIPEVFKSHPDINSRIKRAMEYDPGSDFKTKPFGRFDWKKVKARLEKGDKGNPSS